MKVQSKSPAPSCSTMVSLIVFVFNFKTKNMKKTVITSFFVLSTLFAAAQQYQLGVKGGINISNFNGGNFSNISKKALIGIHAGGYIGFGIGHHLWIQPELLISSQGATLSKAGSTNDTTYKMTYLAIPLMLKYHADGGFFVEAGPQFGFKMSESNPSGQSISSFAKGLDLGIAAGLGYQGKSGLGIYGRYVAGISKVGDFSSTNASQLNPDFKNGTIQLGIMYSLVKRKKK